MSGNIRLGPNNRSDLLSRFDMQIEGGSVFYNAFTTIKEDSGATVNKDYVLSEIKQASTDIAGISQGYTMRRDQTIKADDPGGLKLLATEDEITQLYTKFKASIPSPDGANLIKNLGSLENLSTTRNNAVISYNSALELLHQAITDEAYYTQQQIAYGDQAAKTINPHLPSIILWLRRTRDNFALEAMRLLNYANRAIFYWGLVQPLEFAAPGPLPNSQTLYIAKGSLNKSAENAIDGFAGSTPSKWPVKGRQGPLYKLTWSQKFALQTPQTAPISNDTIYSVAIQLSPGVSSDPDNSGATPLFSGHANIRIDMVRLWLIGASVTPDSITDAEPITVEITQLGSENMQNGRRSSFGFRHSSVTVSFAFESTGIAALSDCTHSRQLGRQFLSEYYIGKGQPDSNSIAAIAP